VAAAGSTALELCFMGIPAVLLSTAPNQRPVAAGLAALGAAHDAGPWEHVTPGALASTLQSLASNTHERERLSVRGRALVDGMGAVRVAARLRSK
jgi:UDP-2,4-diacetamido-2,4,6-trideoxy-beta-L-altropyranose hydrolase